MDQFKYQELENFAAELRKSIITMNCYAGSGHPGGSLSCVEIISWLFCREMNFSPANMDHPERDRFILSKGHSSLTLYAALAEKGFFSKKEFKKLRHVDGMLEAYPDRLKIPGAEFNSGSLGQGFSFALGCALGAKRAGRSNRTYVLLGDGELDEGQIWEGCMFGAHYSLDNLVAVVDYNKLQSDDFNGNITALEPLNDKFKAFGWHVIEIDGHDFREIENSFFRARTTPGKPTMIIAHTIKGKGISYMENVPKWHGSLCPTGEERECALRECGCGELD
ncbi:transketolase [Maridesulfovibrio sp.]|uniref:transketolase n=1 Tax=Maridesulfovibrio sp. TaxID=2795000 RepID=UPI0029CA3A5B|nr:transketolase [Maridesulfovibrio sp.]